jgi:hypothetical protein
MNRCKTQERKEAVVSEEERAASPSQAVDKDSAAGCGGRHLRKTSAYVGASHREKGSSGIPVSGAGRFADRVRGLVGDCTECLVHGDPGWRLRAECRHVERALSRGGNGVVGCARLTPEKYQAPGAPGNKKGQAVAGLANLCRSVLHAGRPVRSRKEYPLGTDTIEAGSQGKARLSLRLSEPI